MAKVTQPRILGDQMGQLIKTAVFGIAAAALGACAATVEANGREASFVQEMARLEGMRNAAYLDQAGIPTICAGHTSDRRFPFAMGTVWSDQKCLEVLAHDLRQARHAVDTYVTVPLTEGQRNALTSFAFNVGNGAFKNSTLLQALNLGLYEDVPSEMRRWNKVTVNGRKRVSQGLVNRREAEIAMWFS